MSRNKIIAYTTQYQLNSNPLPQYAHETAEICRRYCAKWGYEFEIHGMPPGFERDRPHPWTRVFHGREILKRHDVDFVIYVDADAFFTDFSISADWIVEKLKTHDMIFAPDVRDAKVTWHADLPNAGVFAASHKALDLFDMWWDVPNWKDRELIYDTNRYLDCLDTLHNHPYEQLALWFLYKEQKDRILLLDDYRQLNGRNGFYVQHMVQHPDNIRLAVARKFLAQLPK